MGFCKVPPEDAGCQQGLGWGEHHGDEGTVRLGLQPALQLILPRRSAQTSLCWDTGTRVAMEGIEIEEKLFCHLLPNSYPSQSPLKGL